MHNAPPGKLNLPLLNRAEKIQEFLNDIFEIAPEVAAQAFPAIRKRRWRGRRDSPRLRSQRRRVVPAGARRAVNNDARNGSE